MKEKILAHLKANQRATLAQIYEIMPDKTKASVRGSINLMVKTGLIKRDGRGVYML